MDEWLVGMWVGEYGWVEDSERLCQGVNEQVVCVRVGVCE